MTKPCKSVAGLETVIIILDYFGEKAIWDGDLVHFLVLQRSAKKYANLAKQEPGKARQGQAEQVSKSSNKLLATTYKPFSRSLYIVNIMR